MIGYAVLAIAAIAVFAFVLQPLISSQRRAPVSTVPARIADLQARRQYLMQAIRDVDFDYASGKMLEDEHQETRSTYIREAATVLRDLERESSEFDDEIEVEILQLRAMARQSQMAAEEDAASS
jgi:hypothetical protein